jgi:predicted Zn-dependent peptidase
MKKILFILVVLQGVLLSSVVDSIEIKGVKVPVIFEKDSSLPIVSMQLVFKNSGSLFSGKKEGLSKFVASMLNEGTKSDGAVGFAKKLEDSAINLSASTGNETFVFEMGSLKEQFPKGVKLLTKLLNKPNFIEDALKKVKLLKMSLLKQKEDDFDYIAGVNLRKILFPNTPLAHSFIGTKESIESISLKDVEDFYKKHIVLKRLVVVIGGDVDEKEAKKYIKEIVSQLEVGDIEKLPFFETTKEPSSKEVFKDTKQAYIYFGSPYNLSATDKEYYKARVATFILGAGGFGSRLMEEIRVKRGLAYSAYAQLSVNMTNHSLRGYLQTKTQNKDEAIKIVKEVIKNFVKNGVTQKELDSAKKFILGSEPLRNETLSQRLSNAFMLFYKGLPQDHDKKVLKRIEELKLEDLNSFIKKHSEINSLSFSIVTKR